MAKIINAKIPIDQIVVDSNLYPRNDYNWQTGYDYSQSMKMGAKFPKIVVAKLGNAYVLVDGRHRMEAYKILKQKKVDVVVFMKLTEKQIFEEAVRRNIAHGRPFSIQEKLQIAAKLKDMSYNTSNICTLVQITPDKLKNLMGRRLINTLTGEEVVLKKSVENIGSGGGTHIPTSVSQNIAESQKYFSGNSQQHIVNELIVLIKSKSLDLKDKKLKAKLKILRALLRKVKL